MNNIEKNVKRWIEFIQTEQLDRITDEIQVNSTENVNKHVFKLLLYLSHTADRCNKRNSAIGKEIYRLTCQLRLILTEIPDSKKFISSLYHIIRCLLIMCMYKEAFRVCSFLNTEAICISDTAVSDILLKIAYLWSNAVNSAFNILQRDPSNLRYYYEMKDVIKYELDMIRIAYIKIIIKEDEKYVISRYVLHIVSRVMCEYANEESLKTAIQVLGNLSNCFKPILIEDEECYQCYQQLESLCLIIMKPIECLVNNTANSIQDFCNDYLKIPKRYGYSGSIKWTTFSIVQILQSLFIYWEMCIKAGKKVFLRNNVLLEIMNLVPHISKCFLHQISDKCKSCQSRECMVRTDMYNVIVIKTRCINLISKLSANDLSKDICRLAQRFLEQNVAHIYKMKECRCKCWPQLWSTCSALLYNLGIMSECFYKESVSLFSLLCSSIVQFEGVQQKSQYINLQNPICFTLHRLSSLHYNHGMYREAMTVTALNALLSYKDSDTKAFRMWANIKHKSVNSKEIMEMTILSCLKTDRAKIEELGLFFELSQYDLVEICLREAKGLQEAKVNLSDAIRKVLGEMITLNATPILYARVVQMLVYHLLNFVYIENTLDCLKQAVSNLERIKTSNSVLCLQANLEFYIFITKLQIMSEKTQVEMENTKFALHAPKISEIGENESRDVVPAYSTINIKEDSRLVTYLETPLGKWNKCLEQNIEEIVRGSEPLITLYTLIIAGEYARLYRYQKCEVNIWKLAYKLASEMQDNRAIIYITGRSVSLRHINQKWIITAKELANKLQDTNDEDTIYAIAYGEARKLLNESRKLPGISFFSNTAVYLYSLDRILWNCSMYKEDIKHEEYTRYIVETLYTIVNLNEELSAKKWKSRDKYLFGFDILLSATINLSLRMNSLLSFREIGAHLVRRLRTAQTLGATIRVAEVLKSLCYIDLSRSQLSDCEVKLQGLEHILNIESFKASMTISSAKVTVQNVLTPVRVLESVRDVPQNDASPILRNKCFDLPEFMLHTDCACYACQNLSYCYLVFVGTHIRAQLYALQKKFSASLQHFSGAFRIKEKLIKMEKSVSRQKKGYFSLQERLYSIDYVLLLINFSYFLNNYLKPRQDKTMNILFLAVKICGMYKLKGHPVYMSVKELILNYRFQKTIDSLDCSTFTVLKSSDINLTKYIQESKTEDTICVTPTTNNSRTKKPITLKRNRTPPLLKLNKVSMNFSDDEDNTSSSTYGYRRTRSRSKLTRRKIFDEEDTSNTSKALEDINEPRKVLLQEPVNLNEENISNISMNDVINKITSLVPDVSEYLLEAVDKLEDPVTSNNMQQLIKKIEDLKLNATTQKNVRKTRHLKQLTSNDCKKINKIIAFFKDLGINEKEDKNNLMSERSNISESNSVERLEPSNLFVEQYNSVDNLKKIHSNESTKSKITRQSVKQSITPQETHNAKTRSSKRNSS
ncbi:hypothetical protein WN55_05962 [Dufourea novaeangliae]|uniref:Uncharacterized protein n=1 Tax=Dufourea novaeangliae TaxID=178035 RepID=A0A154PPK3_DUFNO|nr:hypothetical protein WN55_05962 [Dufourea novaeangliae]